MEKQYNPFYAVVAQKFCAANYNFRFSFQFLLWDRLKDLEVRKGRKEGKGGRKGKRGGEGEGGEKKKIILYIIDFFFSFIYFFFFVGSWSYCPWSLGKIFCLSFCCLFSLPLCSQGFFFFFFIIFFLFYFFFLFLF